LKSFYRIAKTNLMFNAFGSEEAKPVQCLYLPRDRKCDEKNGFHNYWCIQY